MDRYHETDLAEALEAFVGEHAEIIGDGERRLATLLGADGPARVPLLEGGGREPGRVARLFVEHLRRRGFRVSPAPHPLHGDHDA